MHSFCKPPFGRFLGSIHYCLLATLSLSVAFNSYGGEPSEPSLEVTNLRCEYLSNPHGIDVNRPRVTWQLTAAKRDVKQTAYQVLVASSSAALAQDSGDLWDSGKVVSDDTALIAYQGAALGARERCFWKVRCWDGQDVPSRWSESANWTMGLLESSDWQGQWIGQPDRDIADGLDSVAPWFRKRFTLDQKPVRATAYIACMGYYELYLGSKKVGDAVLAPAVSDYAHRAYYVTHDVTDLIVNGDNCIGLWLGRGWYVNGLPGVTHRGPIARVQIEIDLQDGRTVTIGSDASWKSHGSSVTALHPKIRAGGYNYGGGERIDFRIHDQEWNRVDFDDSSWSPATVVEPSAAKLVAQMVQPNRLLKKILPIAIERLDSGEYLLDMGKNFTGWFQIRFEAEPDKTVRLEYTELRPPDKDREKYLQYDECIPKDGKPTVFRNRFNYHSFRFVKITGLKKAPRREDAVAWLIDTDFRRVGEFACSNSLLNEIYQTVVWTYQCVTLGGYAVDCPHRERLGYGGDGQVTMDTGLFTFDVGAMNTKWLVNWRDAQDSETGALPNTAPYPHSAGGGPTWGAISVMLPWELYTHYGDERVLHECYDMMQRYLAFLDSKSSDNLLRPFGHKLYGFLGDWVAPGRDQGIGQWSDEEWRTFFNNCFYIYLNQLMEKIATVLDKPADAHVYRDKALAIGRATNAEYFREETASYVNGEQPYLAFPLYIGLVPEADRNRVLANLENEIVNKNNGHLQTGMHGTYFLLKCLTQVDRDDLAFQMINQRDYPSWGYMLDQGATTIWERWDGEFSRIHSTLLAVGSWFPEVLCGIRPDVTMPGFKHFTIRPQIVGDVTWAKAHYDTIRGRVACDWKVEQGILSLTVNVPANSTATIVIPADGASKVVENGQPLATAAGVHEFREAADSVIIDVGSGRYVFQCQAP